MFAVATWALFIGLTMGWTGPVYRTFFLFGAVLNIPVLAVGSMFLVVGKKAGHVLTLAVGAIAAISTTLTLTVPFENPLPSHGIPVDIFSLGFSPRLFAIIGGALGSTILIALSLISVFRFWRRNRLIVWGNALILLGVFAAAWRGTGLALGDGGGFAFSLLLAVSLIWAGYKVASGKRGAVPEVPISRLQVATVYVSDADDAIRFWTEQLKFEIVADWSGDAGERMIFVRPPDAVTEIGLYEAGEGDLRVGKPTGLVFTSSDVRATVHQMKEKGVKIVADVVMHDYGDGDKPEDLGDLEATFADPDGNTFLIHS